MNTTCFRALKKEKSPKSFCEGNLSIKNLKMVMQDRKVYINLSYKCESPK